MRRIEVTRQLGDGAVAAVGALLDDAERADGHRAVDEHRWLDMAQGGRDAFAGVVAWEDDRAVGYAQVSRGRSWALDLVVAPDRRSELAAVGTELLGEAVATIEAEGGGHVHLWVNRPTPVHDAVAARVGLTPGRDLYQMRRPLPLEEPPPELELRAFDPEHDAEAWLEVNNRAFHWHPEQGGWDRHTLEERQREPWFDREGFLLHERDGRLAGFCWTKVHRDVDPPLGEIYVIAVHPDFQGLGLGRSLTVAGLDWLARHGLTVGMLYVDASNAAALALYEALGFTIDHTDRAYVGDIGGSETD